MTVRPETLSSFGGVIAPGHEAAVHDLINNMLSLCRVLRSILIVLDNRMAKPRQEAEIL